MVAMRINNLITTKTIITNFFSSSYVVNFMLLFYLYIYMHRTADDVECRYCTRTLPPNILEENVLDYVRVQHKSQQP